MQPVKILFRDRDHAVVEAWREQLDECPEVDIAAGDILECGADLLVVPGNAFGFLDRGLELAVCERFGWEIQDRLRAEARERFWGEMLVGQAVRIPLPAPFKELVYTCICRTPQPLAKSVNAYLAARGAFLEIGRSEGARSAVLPGLGTGALGLHPLISARQVRYAYELYSSRRGFGDKNLTQLSRRERKLRSLPRSARESAGEGSAEGS